MTQPSLDMADAARALGELIPGSGFELRRANVNEVFFSRGEVVLAISFYAEDALPRPLNIALGLLDRDGGMRLVGAWELIPLDAEARGYSSWRVSDQDELVATLQRVFRVVVEPWLLAYLNEPATLVLTIEDSEQRREANYESSDVQRLILSARRSFEVGDYLSAVESYALAGDGLPAADLKRLDIARRRSQSTR